MSYSAIDESTKLQTVDNVPVLLFAFDIRLIEIDLAFPCRAGGKLSRDKLVSFDNDDSEREVFWTVRLLRMDIADAGAARNLPIVLKFICEALQILDDVPSDTPRIHYREPLVPSSSSRIASISNYGPNVTILSEDGVLFVYNEYCYHLRDNRSGFSPVNIFAEKDKRQPPAQELLDALGKPYYTSERVLKGPFETSVLRYPFIKGNAFKPTIGGWLQILGQIQRMHRIGFVHGDLFPQNVVFDDQDGGYVIDFDLSRKEGQQYVSHLLHSQFRRFCHPNAFPGRQMEKHHDVHALRAMSCYCFSLEEDVLISFDLKDLIQKFTESTDIQPRLLTLLRVLPNE